MHRSALILGLVVASTTGRAAWAHDDFNDVVLPAAPGNQGSSVNVEEHLGAKLPLDASFRTSDGSLVSLGDVLAGDIPTILTFNYSDCPMLCSLQLNGLTKALPQLDLAIGAQFRVVTIDLEPKESIDKVAKMKARYTKDVDPKGWTFLVAAVPGDDTSIRRVADAVGFHYAYVPERAEWAHPAALMFISTKGTVTRYVYGIEYEPAIVRESIFKAGLAEPSTAVGFMNRCYHFDPDANSHAHAGVIAMRVAAAGFVVLLLAGWGVMRPLRRHSRSNG